jgi:hypothetical protein
VSWIETNWTARERKGIRKRSRIVYDLGTVSSILPSEVYPKVTFSLHNKFALFNDDVYHHDNHPHDKSLLETGFRKDKTSYLPRRTYGMLSTTLDSLD